MTLGPSSNILASSGSTQFFISVHTWGESGNKASNILVCLLHDYNSVLPKNFCVFEILEVFL